MRTTTKRATTKRANDTPRAAPAQAIMQYGTGVVKGNPKRCLACHKPIRRGEPWTKHTSPPDPQFGSYSFIIHTRCNGKNGKQ